MTLNSETKFPLIQTLILYFPVSVGQTGAIKAPRHLLLQLFLWLLPGQLGDVIPAPCRGPAPCWPAEHETSPKGKHPGTITLQCWYILCLEFKSCLIVVCSRHCGFNTEVAHYRAGTHSLPSPLVLHFLTSGSQISCILIHHTAISFHFNSDFGFAAPPLHTDGITSEIPPLALLLLIKKGKPSITGRSSSVFEIPVEL